MCENPDPTRPEFSGNKAIDLERVDLERVEKMVSKVLDAKNMEEIKEFFAPFLLGVYVDENLKIACQDERLRLHILELLGKDSNKSKFGKPV
jgi:hypothetical protein